MSEQLNDDQIIQAGFRWAKERGFFDFERNDFIGCVRELIALSTHHAAPGAPQQEASGAHVSNAPIGFTAYEKSAWSFGYEEGFRAAATAPTIKDSSIVATAPEDLREFLGKMVRLEWTRWAAEQPNPKPSWLKPWNELDEPDKEVDRRIGEAIWRFSFARDAALTTAARAAEPKPAPGMAVQALAGEIIAALLADEKDGGYDLTGGLFGPAFSELVRRWAAAEIAASPTPPTGTSQGEGTS